MLFRKYSRIVQIIPSINIVVNLDLYLKNSGQFIKYKIIYLQFVYLRTLILLDFHVNSCTTLFWVCRCKFRFWVGSKRTERKGNRNRKRNKKWAKEKGEKEKKQNITNSQINKITWILALTFWFIMAFGTKNTLLFC